MIRQIILLVAWTCIAITLCSAQGSGDPLRKPPMAYELYSWRGANGSWNFSLLASPSGVNLRADQVFNKKFLSRGVDGVNREISKVPIGATIYWLDHITPEAGPKTKESESLRYPPADIIEQIRQYADKCHIKIDMWQRMSVSESARSRAG
jgi:hypothetical protein